MEIFHSYPSPPDGWRLELMIMVVMVVVVVVTMTMMMMMIGCSTPDFTLVNWSICLMLSTYNVVFHCIGPMGNAALPTYTQPTQFRVPMECSIALRWFTRRPIRALQYSLMRLVIINSLNVRRKVKWTLWLRSYSLVRRWFWLIQNSSPTPARR